MYVPVTTRTLVIGRRASITSFPRDTQARAALRMTRLSTTSSWRTKSRRIRVQCRVQEEWGRILGNIRRPWTSELHKTKTRRGYGSQRTWIGREHVQQLVKGLARRVSRLIHLRILKTRIKVQSRLRASFSLGRRTLPYLQRPHEHETEDIL